MRFADITGYAAIKKALAGMADSGRVAHAMLLYENDGCGALALALAYAQYLACEHPHDGDSCGHCPSCNRIAKLIHPDLHVVFPTNTGSKSGKTKAENIVSDVYMEDFRVLAVENPYFLESQLMEAIGLETKSWDVNVAEAKELSRILSLTSIEGGWKFVIFYLPETLRLEAANKLLKLVEEPPEKTLFLFISHQPQKVLQTIFSRCQSLRIPPLSPQEVATALSALGYEEADAAEQARVCGGSIGAALYALRSGDDTRQFEQWFSQLMEALLDDRLVDAWAVGDQIAALSSREKQKAFCIFVSDMLRKIFLMQQDLEDLSYATASRKELCRTLAGRVSPKFASRMQTFLDKTVYYIDRNVNQKILFTDLIDRMSININRV
ncbi:MAG: hypothetical protein J6X69_00705 [Bacteroidales bacterium]|nr:hypothetical protein [Bacteroidales bacterium]